MAMALGSNAQTVISFPIMEQTTLDTDAPCSSCTTWRYARDSKKLYRWNLDSLQWEIFRQGVDSTRLVQDSILVHYMDGSVLSQDTIRINSSSPAVPGQWEVNDTSIYNSNTGNVGIGTSTPESKLTIADGDVLIDNNTAYQAKRVDGTPHQLLILDANDDIVINNSSGIGLSPPSGVSLIIGNDEQMDVKDSDGISHFRIKEATGNIGIGIEPAHKLDVSGSFRTSGVNTFTSVANDNSIVKIAGLNASDQLVWRNVSTIGGGSGTTTGVWVLDTITNKIYYSAGSVGIGVSNPTSALDVMGTINTDSHGSSADWNIDNSISNELQTLGWDSGTRVLELSDGGGTVTITDDAGTDDQQIENLTITGNQLILELENDGQPAQTVDLGPYLDNTDNQQVTGFSISAGNILSIELENDGQPAQTVDLGPYLDNTDNQNIEGSNFNSSTGNLTIGIESGLPETINLDNRYLEYPDTASLSLRVDAAQTDIDNHVATDTDTDEENEVQQISMAVASGMASITLSDIGSVTGGTTVLRKGKGVDIIANGTNTALIINTDAATIVADNHADAAARGVAFGEFFYTSLTNTMGLPAGTKIKRLY